MPKSASSASFDPAGPNRLIHGDNLEVMTRLPDESFALIYLDPPFNTGRDQVRTTLSTTSSEEGSRGGFGGRRYEVTAGDTSSYSDSYEDYLGFLGPRLLECWRLLQDDGTLYVHLDWREVHYVKVWLDQHFGRERFLNEIIWAYDYGGKSKKRWPTKHDTILVYVKNPDRYQFHSDKVDREPYMAPGLVDEEKRARGKLPTDVWWHTIVSPTGKEKTGWATQKPLGVLRRIILASSSEGDWILDPFGGSGTTAAAAAELRRRFVTIDSHPDAVETMRKRLAVEPG